MATYNPWLLEISSGEAVKTRNVDPYTNSEFLIG
jgi:hypothetical protein